MKEQEKSYKKTLHTNRNGTKNNRPTAMSVHSQERRIRK